MEDRLKHYAKRLADYVRLAIEVEYIKADSPVGLAYWDFIAEVESCEQEDSTDAGNPSVLEGVDYHVNQVDAEMINLTRHR